MCGLYYLIHSICLMKLHLACLEAKLLNKVCTQNDKLLRFQCFPASKHADKHASKHASKLQASTPATNNEPKKQRRNQKHASTCAKCFDPRVTFRLAGPRRQRRQLAPGPKVSSLTPLSGAHVLMSPRLTVWLSAKQQNMDGVRDATARPAVLH